MPSLVSRMNLYANGRWYSACERYPARKLPATCHAETGVAPVFPRVQDLVRRRPRKLTDEFAPTASP